MRNDYYDQMTEYYDGAKYNFDFDSVRQSIVERYEKRGPLDNTLIDIISKQFAGKRVLELACGGGFWTRYIAEVAEQVIATDVSARLIDVARDLVTSANTEFLVCDARFLNNLPDDFTAAFHFNYINHVPLEDWDNWLDHLHDRLAPGAVVLMGGQAYQGKEKDAGRADFYSIRSGLNGKSYKLIDNYPDEQTIWSHLASRSSSMHYKREDGWWCAYTVS